MAKQSYNPSNIAVIGMEWGDEGKGKIIDFLADKADVIARFNGGNNAGHTIEVRNNKLVVHLVPSGVMYKNKLKIIFTIHNLANLNLGLLLGLLLLGLLLGQAFLDGSKHFCAERVRM